MLKAGDKIKIRDNSDEFLYGEIIALLPDGQVKILLDDGFEIIAATDDVMKVDLVVLNPWFRAKTTGKVKQDEPVLAAKENSFVSISRYISEVDIHIEKIIPSSRGLDAAKMLQIQLDFTKNAVENALKMHQHKIILIHGTGNGKLRNTIRSYLRKHHPKCEVINADKMKYGDGATEVILH